MNLKSDWQDADLHLSVAEALQPILATNDDILFDCPPSWSLASWSLASLSLVSLSLASDGHYVRRAFVVIPLEAARWGAIGT